MCASAYIYSSILRHSCTSIVLAIMDLHATPKKFLPLLIIMFVAAVDAARYKTKLATFNAALVPFYPGNDGNAYIEERVDLLIAQVEELH